MTSPWLWLKKRWYHRQATKAIWFMRYMDRVARGTGWTRGKVRQMWRDFTDNPTVRMSTLYQLAAINKIKLRKAMRIRAEERLSQTSRELSVMTSRFDKVSKDLAESQAKVKHLEDVQAMCDKKADEILDSLKEAKDEVHTG